MTTIKNILLSALIVLGLFGCREKEPPGGVLQCIVHGDTLNHHFLRADSAKNSTRYQEAVFLYRGLATNAALTKAERNYARLSALLCELLSPSVSPREIRYDTLTAYEGEISCAIVKGLGEINRGKSGAALLLEAKQRLKQTRAIRTFEYFLTLELLGINYRMIEGNMDSAMFYFKEALRYTKDYSILSPHEPRLLLEIADVCIINRDEITGLTYATEAFRIASDPYFRCKSLIIKGTLFRKLSAYDSSRLNYKKAREFIVAYTLKTLEVDLLSEEILNAIILKDNSLYEALIRNAERQNSAGTNKINIDRLLGYAFYEKQDYQKSILHYERALTMIRSSRVPDLVLVMEAYYALSEQYAKINQFDKAEEYAYKSLVYTTSLQDTPYSWRSVLNTEVENENYNFVNYNLLAEILLSKAAHEPFDLSSAKKALTLYKLVDSLMLKQVRVTEEEAVINFLSIGHAVYSGGIEACYLLYEKTREIQYLSQAHHFMERGKGIIMYRDILVHSRTHFPTVPNEFRERELQLKSRLSNLRQTTSIHSKEMMNAIDKLERYYVEMSQKYPDYYEAKYELKVPSYNFFQNWSLTDKTTIVQFHLSDKYVYALTYDKNPTFTRIDFDTTLRHGMVLLRDILENAPELNGDLGLTQFMDLSSELHSRLIAPLHLSNRSVLIIPDGDLSSIPFEILASDKGSNFQDASYLVKKYTLKYAQSLTTYKLSVDRSKRDINNILTYSYGNGSNNQVSLPGTEKESQLIREIFTGKSVTFRTDEQLTKARVLKDLSGSYDLIHIGLHSSSSTSDRLSNRILCMNDNTSDVYGFEIVPLSIKAHTVVLSSCQSAYGTHIVGEGTYSLARAFSQTGVNTVVSSLWNLTDHSTVTIIDSFYNSLSKGYSASESLTAAKRQYLVKADEITAHPFYWASMICLGD